MAQKAQQIDLVEPSNIVDSQKEPQNEQKNSSPWLCYFYAMLGNIFMSLDAFFVKLIPDMSALQVTYFRSMALFLINYLLLKRKGEKRFGKTPRGNKLLILRGFIGFFMSCFYYTGLSILPFSEGIVLFFTNPIIMTLLAAIVLGEALEIKDLITSALCVFGVVMVIKPGLIFELETTDGNEIKSGIDLTSMVMIFGVFCILAAATGRSMAGIVVRMLRAHASPLLITFQYGAFSTMAVPGLIVFSGGVGLYTIEAVIKVGIMGVCGFLGQYFFVSALAVGNASKVGMLGYFQIVFAFVLDIIVMGKQISFYSILGTMLICSSLFVNIYKTIRDKEV